MIKVRGMMGNPDPGEYRKAELRGGRKRWSSGERERERERERESRWGWALGGRAQSVRVESERVLSGGLWGDEPSQDTLPSRTATARSTAQF